MSWITRLRESLHGPPEDALPSSGWRRNSATTLGWKERPGQDRP